MASDEKYIDCPECGKSVLMTLNVQSNEWNGYCDNCQEHGFVKNINKDDIEITHCPLCGVFLGEDGRPNKEIRCKICGYKFEVYVPDEQ